jgi:hypothetical protein
MLGYWSGMKSQTFSASARSEAKAHFDWYTNELGNKARIIKAHD